jgi:hypothetical protein
MRALKNTARHVGAAEIFVSKIALEIYALQPMVWLLDFLT